MNKLDKIAILVLLLFAPLLAHGQQTGIKTNLLYWATTTPNLGIETSLGKKTTLDIQAGYNPWRLSSKAENEKLQHFLIQPELRLWNCEKFNGGFWGLHAIYANYNVGGVELPFGLMSSLENRRYDGWLAGAGISYGHQWYLSPHWNLEATIGVGYAYLKYKRYDCPRCGDFLGKEDKHYFGPTKVGVSFVYLFKSKK